MYYTNTLSHSKNVRLQFKTQHSAVFPGVLAESASSESLTQELGEGFINMCAMQAQRYTLNP